VSDGFEALLDRAAELADGGDRAAAIAHLEASPGRQAALIRFAMAKLLAEERRWDDALVELDLAIEDQPEIANFHLSRATVLIALGRHEAARRDAERAIDLDRAEPLAHAILGQALEGEGRLGAALMAYQKARLLAGREVLGAEIARVERAQKKRRRRR
jgi:tetratricopeptide (TPR) repeat protein